MADTGSPPPDTGLEARVARLESDVAHIQADIAEIKTTLNRLAPLIDELMGFLKATLPGLATKIELAEARSELKSEIGALRSELKSEIAELRLEIMQRPTRRQTVFDIFAIVGFVGIVLTIAARFSH